MARSEAAKARQGLSTNGKVTRTKREVGQYGNTRPREDASVRRARRMETDGRLKAAKAEQEAHEKKLATLADALADQPHVPYYVIQEAVASVALDRDETHVVGEPHTPYRPTLVSQEQVAEFVERTTREQGVPLRVQDPATLQKVATLLSVPSTRQTPAPSRSHNTQEARDLLAQGYHISRVVARTGVDPEALRHLVADDGYAK